MAIRTDRGIRLDDTYFDDNGFFYDNPIIASVGVYVYKNADGTERRELRLPKDVFDPDSMKSLEGKSIVLTHATNKGGLVDCENYRDYDVGTVLRVYRDGDNLRCDIVVKDAQTLKKSPDLRELSPAYTCTTIKQRGEYNGEAYDEIQTNIRYNNLAIVKEARAGKHARLNLDDKEGGNKMSKRLPDEGNIDLDSMDAMIKHRLEVMATAAKIGFDIGKMPTQQAKKEIVKKVMPDIRLDGMDIDTLYTLAKKDIESRKPLKEQYEGLLRTDGLPPSQSSYDEARRKYEKEFFGGAK